MGAHRQHKLSWLVCLWSYRQQHTSSVRGISPHMQTENEQEKKNEFLKVLLTYINYINIIILFLFFVLFIFFFSPFLLPGCIAQSEGHLTLSQRSCVQYPV